MKPVCQVGEHRPSLVGENRELVQDCAERIKDYQQDLFDAHAQISRLTASNERLAEALEPFADYAELVAREHPGWDHDDFAIGLDAHLPRMAAFRKARAALKEEGGEQ